MAIDLEKMRAKLSALENRGKKEDSAFWRPQDGEQTVRIVPTPDGDPFKEYWFHYNLGKNPGFLSPKRNFGVDDPLNDFVRQLFNEGTDDSIKQAKELMARQRFFAPVLVRGEEEKGVRIWGFGKMAYQELLNLVLNPEYGDITDTETGTDLVIKYGKPPGAQFPQTTITPRRRSSPHELVTTPASSRGPRRIPRFPRAAARKMTRTVYLRQTPRRRLSAGPSIVF